MQTTEYEPPKRREIAPQSPDESTASNASSSGSSFDSLRDARDEVDVRRQGAQSWCRQRRGEDVLREYTGTSPAAARVRARLDAPSHRRLEA